MFFEVDGNNYEVVIIKKNNKNTYIRVKEDLKIYVTTNKYTSNRVIKKLLDENYNSIVSMLERTLRKNARNEKSMILGKENTR